MNKGKETLNIHLLRSSPALRLKASRQLPSLGNHPRQTLILLRVVNLIAVLILVLLAVSAIAAVVVALGEINHRARRSLEVTAAEKGEVHEDCSLPGVCPHDTSAILDKSAGVIVDVEFPSLCGKTMFGESISKEIVVDAVRGDLDGDDAVFFVSEFGGGGTVALVDDVSCGVDGGWLGTAVIVRDVGGHAVLWMVGRHPDIVDVKFGDVSTVGP